MIDIVLDFETYYDSEITLKKLNFSEYAVKTHPLCVSLIVKGQEPIYAFGESIQELFDTIDWDQVNLICHNTMFDSLILKVHYGIVCKNYSDTLSASRILHPTLKHDLGTLSRLLKNYTAKNHAALSSIKGKTWDAMTVYEQQTLCDYCLNDSKLTKQLYKLFYPQLSEQEKKLINHTIKLWLRPTLILDDVLARNALEEERTETARLIEESGLSRTDIRSDAKFGAYLISQQYEPPTKFSDKKQTNIFAFAKSDEGFKQFYEENPELQPLLDLKRRINSNIQESRTERLLSTCAVNDSKIPIAYNYAGAFTARFCLTGDTIISVLRNQEVLDILLPDLLPNDLVWDGTAFVPHGGLIDQGIREVMTYDSITGTPDHRVFVEEITAPVELRTAMERSYTLKTAKPAPKLTTNASNTTRRCEK